MKKKVIKILVCCFSVFALICLALMLICNLLVVNNAEGKVFSDIDSIKYNKVGLLLGTTPQARFDRITNYFFIYRIDAAEQLYKAGKIEKILISGDEHSLDGISETECMKDSLVARGIPANAIILDGKGYRTICSVINANKVFGFKNFTISRRSSTTSGLSIRLSISDWMWRICRHIMRKCLNQDVLT